MERKEVATLVHERFGRPIRRIFSDQDGDIVYVAGSGSIRLRREDIPTVLKLGSFLKPLQDENLLYELLIEKQKDGGNSFSDHWEDMAISLLDEVIRKEKPAHPRRLKEHLEITIRTAREQFRFGEHDLDDPATFTEKVGSITMLRSEGAEENWFIAVQAQCPGEVLARRWFRTGMAVYKRLRKINPNLEFAPPPRIS